MTRVLAFLVIACLGPACFMGLAWKDALPGGYELVAVDTLEQMQIYTPRNRPAPGARGVRPCVYQVAHDQRHILAAQHPDLEPPFLKIDASQTNYWVIDIATDQTHGPFDDESFERARVELSVDRRLTLKQITERLK